ncbi:MAG: CDP-diacylglycerol--serine O-phosphatidyltransferase [Bacteroidetes bacterium]|nr:MAG: CDP-diacylglycerol--serine O-phosphatidyltransferase [Bacteroidota bacterium]
MNMKKYLSWLPNAITLTNLLCGSIAIVMLLNEQYENAIILVFISLLADFLDGLIARGLNIQSVIGKDLDSLADLVTFGLLPAIVLYHLAEQQEHSVWNYLCFLVVLFSAIRLAKFNHDTRQSYYFRGLPTPANAIFVLSLLIFSTYESPEISEHSFWLKWNTVILSKIIYSTKTIRFLSIISSVLLITPINLISFKSPRYTFSAIKHQLILMAGIILLTILFGKFVLFWAILWYILWSVIWYYFIL